MYSATHECATDARGQRQENTDRLKHFSHLWEKNKLSFIFITMENKVASHRASVQQAVT